MRCVAACWASATAAGRVAARPLDTVRHGCLFLCSQTSVMHGCDVIPTICPATADALREEMTRRWVD